MSNSGTQPALFFSPARAACWRVLGIRRIRSHSTGTRTTRAHLPSLRRLRSWVERRPGRSPPSMLSRARRSSSSRWLPTGLMPEKDAGTQRRRRWLRALGESSLPMTRISTPAAAGVCRLGHPALQRLVVALRVRDGDDSPAALNLNRAQRPRLLGSVRGLLPAVMPSPLPDWSPAFP